MKGAEYFSDKLKQCGFSMKEASNAFNMLAQSAKKITFIR